MSSLCKDRFILMNKDKKVALLSVGSNVAYIDKIYSEIPHYIEDIYSWIQDRTTIFGRDNLLMMAKIAGISNEVEFLSISKALSINDTLWVNDLKNPTTWNKVNPYTNRLSRIMADMAINGIDNYRNQNIKSPSPQYRVDGSVDKCIKRKDGKLYLYKTDGEKWSDLAGCRPYSEYYVSELCKILGLNNFTEYNIEIHRTESNKIKTYTCCKIFTDEKNGLVQMCDTKMHRVEMQELIRKIPKQSAKTILDMAVLDSITLNFDRHSGNYGFIVDNDNYNIKCVAPIYDNDCALGSLTSLQGKSIEEAFNELKTTRLPKLGVGDYDDMARWGMTKDMYNKLRSLEQVKLKQLPGISDKRIEFINYIINRRIKEVINLF